MTAKNQQVFLEKLNGNISEIKVIGDERKKEFNNPFLGLENVEFQEGYVKINVPNENPATEIELKIFEGDPAFDNQPPSTFIANGLIEVGKEGLLFEYGERKKIPWPEGVTDVLVILNVPEIVEGKLKSITMHLSHTQKTPWAKKIANQIKSIWTK